MREAEAQLQAIIQSAGSFIYGTGTTAHNFLPVTSVSSSASSSASHLLSPPTSVGTGGLFGGTYVAVPANASQILGEKENASFGSSLMPRLGMEEGGGGGRVSVNVSQDEMEKARVRQVKAAMRRERNKAAARRSNLNRKLFRDQLEKKSLELWEENLQLQQDIWQLSNQLRHYCHVRRAMRHVCHAMVPPPPPPYSAAAVCRS